MQNAGRPLLVDEAGQAVSSGSSTASMTAPRLQRAGVDEIRMREEMPGEWPTVAVGDVGLRFVSVVEYRQFFVLL